MKTQAEQFAEAAKVAQNLRPPNFRAPGVYVTVSDEDPAKPDIGINGVDVSIESLARLVQHIDTYYGGLAKFMPPEKPETAGKKPRRKKEPNDG